MELWQPSTNTRKLILEVVGVLLLLTGIVFALQGANVIGGSAVMSGVTSYIYIGVVVAIVGLAVLILGLRSGGAASGRPPQAASQ